MYNIIIAYIGILLLNVIAYNRSIILTVLKHLQALALRSRTKRKSRIFVSPTRIIIFYVCIKYTISNFGLKAIETFYQFNDDNACQWNAFRRCKANSNVAKIVYTLLEWRGEKKITY